MTFVPQKDKIRVMQQNLLEIKNCRIQRGGTIFVPEIDWSMKTGESWLVLGPNGGGKADFVKALAGIYEFVPGGISGKIENSFGKSVAVVSLEEAASLIEEERNRDESEYLNRTDIGRTGRKYIGEVLKNPAQAENRLETFPEVKLCGIEKILDRGLKFMSTGEIRRTLLCRALLSGAKLVVLSDPFAGLDAESRRILFEFFDSILKRQNDSADEFFPRIILCMERFSEIPTEINRVVEFEQKKISFAGGRGDYENFRKIRENQKNETKIREKQEFLCELKKIRAESETVLGGNPAEIQADESLIRFENVNVGFGDHKVLTDLNWEVKRGEHFLIRGPNGSGKTTIMELITGDNMQVFREKVFLFGKRRGSGESIWDIRKKLGIVSYRLHVEYRMVGGTDLQGVIVSGFKDSIGLYEKAGDFELAAADAWLKLAGFAGREKESFASLSYGEQRAVLILRSAVKSPRLLILDEPCHGLDENYRGKILDLLQTVAETGTTTLLHVTHDMEEILPCEKNVLELCPGEIPMYKLIRI